MLAVSDNKLCHGGKEGKSGERQAVVTLKNQSSEGRKWIVRSQEVTRR